MRKIALTGTAASSLNAPFSDPSWEIWGVSSRGPHVTRANRWYELHRLDGEPPDWAAQWRVKLAQHMADVSELWMIYPEEAIAPGKVRQYPTGRMVARFGTFFMTSTFSWMMAQAIDELRPLGGAPVPGEIAIFGVDMEYGTEYRQQRAGFRHFIALAEALGISVTRLASGGLAYEPVPYPMWQDDPLLTKIELRNREARARIAGFENSLRICRTMIAQNKAVRDCIHQSMNEGWDPQQRLRELDRELEGMMGTSAQLSRDIVHHQAIDSEQNWIRDYLQP